MFRLNVQYRRRAGASRPRRRSAAAPILLIALSVSWVRALPGQEVEERTPPGESGDAIATPDSLSRPAVGDTTPALPELDSLATRAGAQAQEETIDRALRFGMSWLGYPWATFLHRVLEAYGPEFTRYNWTRATDWLASRDSILEARLAARADTLFWLGMGVRKLPPDFDPRRFLRSAEGGRDTVVQRIAREQHIDILPDVLEKYADLDLEVDGSGQLNSRWQTFDPCTINVGQACNAGAVPRFTPEFQLRAIARGTISERFHVNVDFDQTREFDATNDLNVFYQGKRGEILEFAEIGQVTLPLPRSRFISQGIPAGNFGVRGDTRFGPLTLRGVLAEQEGNVLNRKVTLDVGGGGGTVLQDFEAVLDDAAYQTGQFFFLMDPRRIQGYPNIDILSLDGTEVPDSLRPASSVKLYRHEVTAGQQAQNVQEGTIQARAAALRDEAEEDPAVPDSTVFQGFFRPLVEGEDYIVHRSGLWAVIKSRVQRDEALATTYIAVSGDTVGDFDAEEIFRDFTNSGSGELPNLELLKDAATHRPGGVTWDREMHNIYRISSSEDVEQGSVELVISQGPIESGPVVRSFGASDYPFLEIFGLDDQPRDDRMDIGRVWRPSVSGEFAGTSVITGVYLVIPAQEPFRDPPPIRDQREPSLSGQPFPLVSADRNLIIYDEPLDQTRLTGFLYRLNFKFRARSAGAQNSFPLGAIGIREGSEKVVLRGRELQPGEDYTIDYDIGQLTLLRPEELFSGAENPDLEVRFEQKPLFQVGTKSILGFTGTYRMGAWGNVDFIGLFQNEGTVLTRPELGLEPSGVSLGGAVARLDFGSGLMDRITNSLPGINTDRPSRFRFSGELAGSRPTTNRGGTTWVDDFEGTAGIRVGLTTRSWRNGSLVTRPDASDGFLPVAPDIANQLSTVWQSQWEDAGILRGSLLVNQIDPQLNVLNVGNRETVLWVSLDDPPATGENGWFSMTTVLSQTGIDLSTSEFLEFYASVLDETDENLALIIDIGTVSEDAYVADSLGLPAGIGILDQEVDPIVGVWGNQDDTGLWSTGCATEPTVSAWPLGDPRATCTNNNGLEDTEDLNRDNFLNTDERYFRYIVPLTRPSRYLNRPTNGEFRFNLYRLPLRIPDLQQNATDSEQQNVKQVRITLTSSRKAVVLLGRMRFTGSPWLKRAGTGSVDGSIGENPGTAGQVTVGPVSTVDRGYVSPPGLSDQEADKTDELRLSTAAINEQSLRITYTDVPPGQRIEVFRKFTDRPRDFLSYGRFRAWTLAQGDDWGQAGSLRFFLRMGFDANNFYLYRTSLKSAPELPVRDDWRPEDTIDFDRLLALRAEAERRLIEAGSNLPGDSTFVLWDVDVFPDADSTLALVINDRSRAPNLAAIRELAVGIENSSVVAAGPGELWVGDLRLDRAPDDSGLAAIADLDLDFADVLRIQGNVSSVNPFFRQLAQKPTFRSQVDWGARVTLEFGRFLPDRWGLAMPISYQRTSSSEDPFFLPQTDVRSAALGNLRTGGQNDTRWNVALSKQARSGSPLLRATIDGLRVGYTHRISSSTATQTETGGSAWGATAAWSRTVLDKTFPIIPGFLRNAIDLLPDFISQSVLLQNFKNLRFRWTPRQLSLGLKVDRSRDERRRFETSVRRSSDSAVDPIVDLQYVLRPRTGVELQPFPSLVWGFDFASGRDLVLPFRRVSTPAGRRELRSASRDVLGVNVGWETDRSVNTRLSWQPRLASWFDTGFNVATNYRTIRNVSYIQEVGADTTLVRDLSRSRDLGLQIDVRPDALLTALGVPGREDAKGIPGGLRAFWDRLSPFRFDWRKGVSSSFDRRDLSPSFWDQLVLSGFDDLRVVGRDTASAAADNRNWSVEGGYRFPLGLDLTVDYTASDRRTLTARTERRVDETQWPSIQLRWRNVPVPGPLRGGIRNISLTGGWRTRESLTSTTTGQDRGDERTIRSAGVALIFGNGFNLSYDYSNTASERVDATGLSQSDRASHSVRLSGFLAPPGFLGFVKDQMRVSADYSINGNSDCRAIGGTGFGEVAQVFRDDCTTHSDQTTQNASFTLDTDFTGYSIGIQFLWVQRSSAVGRQETSNQYNFNVFGRFFFRASQGEAQFNP